MIDPLSEISLNARKFSYDAIAGEYAAGVDSAPYNALYERPAMLALLPPLEGRRVLDAGCGSGWYAERLLERGARVSAIDASSAMVEITRERLARACVSPDRFDVNVADLGRRLPFNGESFDGIVSPLVLHYMSDWRPALREMRRVLKKDGWLLFSTHHPSADAEMFRPTNYFITEHVVDEWKWVGRVEFYRRSLTEIVSSVVESGFVMERLIEPAPTAELKNQAPGDWERLMRHPAFLIISARPGV